MKLRRLQDFSPKRVLALLILAVALAAGVFLWELRRLHHRQSHSAATHDVLQLGAAIAAHLAAQPEITEPEQVRSWDRFGALVDTLYSVEPGLQHVGVAEDGVVIFQRRAVPPNPSPRAVSNARAPGTRSMDVPLLTFRKEVGLEDGKSRSVEIELRSETVAREELGPMAATTAMFQVAVTIVAVAFGFCIALVLWVMRREELTDRRQREQEHLAFAGAIAGGVVHDFRNPLSSVKLDIQMLREEAARAPAAARAAITELAEHAMHTAGRMEEILDQFLSLSTPREEEMVRVDVGICARECLRILEPRLKRRGTFVNLDIPPGPVVVNAYATSLRRAVVNILTNAEEHSPSGGWIAVRLRAVDGNAILDVTDSGPGVPAADRARVFRMFVSGRPGGTGLGLYLARTAIEKCGGSLEIVDVEEGGCCFRITLAQAEAQQ